MIIDAVIFMSEFRIVLYENDVNRRIVDLYFFGSSAHLPVCLLCQMIAFYNELLSLSKALPLAPENYSVLFYLGRCYELHPVKKTVKQLKESSQRCGAVATADSG